MLTHDLLNPGDDSVVTTKILITFAVLNNMERCQSGRLGRSRKPLSA